MSDRFGFKPDMDVFKMLSDFKMPSIPAMPDMEALAAAQRKNIEAFSAANRVALEGAQAVARRHMEILQQSVAEMTEAMKALSATDAPQDKAAKQAELAKSTYEKAVANLQELAELIQRSNSEALGLLNKRFAEAMDEVKGLVGKQAK
ncbi:phasin family protein [Roseomonas eburnea]|uniref:Phasin family protein n=1 Tax=Neoroseomonas eburnea TaxID=1346889 RepID=A0A9X9XE77_9PROT|nr:TIGR01841 family phasin [Neoroseomonas eburnea]MBR0682013.1 phasin family protein [Neoroseomonas eburnea]